MTEESFQQARKIMQSANFRRGLITAAKGEVAKWTKIEDCYRQDLKPSQADGAKKMLDKAMKKLEEARAKFAELKFPDSDIKKEYVPTRCVECGTMIAKGESYCGECLCEDDSNY